MTDQIARIEGEMTFADGERVGFTLLAGSSSRWGAPPDVLARAVAPCEAMERALDHISAFAPPKPTDGEARTWSVVTFNGAFVIARRDVIANWRDASEYRDGGYWWISQLTLHDMLEDWASADRDHRNYRWPETGRKDDDVIVAYVTPERVLVIETVQAYDDDEYPLVPFIDGSYLPTNQISGRVRS